MKTSCHKKIILTVLVSAIAIFAMTSCGSKKILYNPGEVAYLSELLKIPIENDDPDMPLLAEVSLWLGTPYKYGGDSKKGTDCSGMVYQVFKRVYDKQLERSSEDQAKKNVTNISKMKLRTGDLVFFRTNSGSKKITHVGIFLRNGNFIHSSTSRGVIISNLNENYYHTNWAKGGRVK